MSGKISPKKTPGRGAWSTADPMDADPMNILSVAGKAKEAAETAQNMAKKKQQQGNRFLIDPRTSKFSARWDIATTTALIFTAIITPLEVGFLPAPPDWRAAFFDDRFAPLFWINRIVDLVFILDLFLQFILMYPASAGTGLEGARWVDDFRTIARHYLTGWFALDMLSVSASAFDIVSITVGDELGDLKALRMVRAARLIKLVRLLRASRMLKRWESRVSINYGALALARSASTVVVLAHWFGCIWGLQASLADDIGTTWKGGVGDGDPRQDYCVASTSPYAEHPRYTMEEAGWVCVGSGDLYMASLYWAVMTITSIGYGDVTASRNSPQEQGIAVALMLLGSMAWGNVIATFCGVIATMNPAETEFRQTMDDLNSFMRLQSLPSEMRRRLREYFHQTRHLQLAAAHRSLLATMSPTLQGEVALRCNERWLSRVWFLKGVEEGFMVQIALHLHAMVFAPGELACSGYLYIVHRGIALYFGRIVTAGKVWGEDMILRSGRLRYSIAARAMNYLEVYMMGRSELFDVARSFPSTHKHIRMCAAKLALRRDMVLRARQVKDSAANQRPSLCHSPMPDLASSLLSQTQPTVAPAPPDEKLHQRQVEAQIEAVMRRTPKGKGRGTCGAQPIQRKNSRGSTFGGAAAGQRRNTLADDEAGSSYSIGMSVGQSSLVPRLATPRGEAGPAAVPEGEAAAHGETHTLLAAQAAQIRDMGRSLESIFSALSIDPPTRPSPRSPVGRSAGSSSAQAGLEQLYA